jgi:hypothetical protein
MRTDPEHEELLSDVFAEEWSASASREAVAAMLRAARARRRWRQVRRGGAAAIVGAAAFLLSRAPIWSPRAAAVSPPAFYTLVATRPLPSNELVATIPLAPELLVSTAGATRMVRSTSLGYSELSDEELLTWVAARPAVLVRSSSGFEHLVFANPDDAQGFPVN